MSNNFTARLALLLIAFWGVIALIISTVEPANALDVGGSLGAGMGGDTIPNINWYELREVALCDAYGNLFGSCSRVAETLGVSVDKAREVAAWYGSLPTPEARAEYAEGLGL